MLQGVNIDEIKKYNASLKQCRDRAASLNAEIEYTNKEIDNLCNELSAELGVTVTRDNIEQIYNEQVEKINSTLQSGNAVLSKIANEENSEVPQPQVTAPIATEQSIPTVSVPTASVPITNTQEVVAQTSAPLPEAPPIFAQPQVGGQQLPPFFNQ